MRAWLLLLAACHNAAGLQAPDGNDTDAAVASDSATLATSTVSAETGNNTAASPLFRDDYRNYNTSAQTGNSNGDFVPRAVSHVPLATLTPGVAHRFVETQTWFCHLAANESGNHLVSNARCGSHIDVGYSSDEPAQVARQVADLQARGVEGVVMDWSGREKGFDGYPTGSWTDHDHTRPSTEVSTNAIYALRDAAEATGSFQFMVMEDEGITNCRKGWAGGCACWPAYGSTCNMTSQVISDLSYIQQHWASSPAYYQLDGKPAVGFFAPDYNACPDATAADCQHIDWAAVHQYVPDQVWIFENKPGFAHAYSGGAFSWLSTTLYPGSDSSFGTKYLDDFNATAATSGKHVLASAFKGFDDAVTDGWNYGDGSHTRYIEQRCGKTWLDTLAKLPASADMLQLVTWDDYEEATELETGIDTCLQSIDAQLDGTHLAWSLTYGKDLTGGATGSEDTVDHFIVWASPDGEHLIRVAPDTHEHALDLPALPAGTQMLFVEAVGKPFLANSLSAPISIRP